jgi:hypothetical protein
MYYDNLTAWLTIWGLATTVAIIAVAACKGCCIAKLLGKPCRK